MFKRADLLEARVPRYTSYPTAPHFHAGITGDTFRDWLTELPDGMPVSLYLHVPFCDTLCWFCGCHTKIVNSYSPLASYLDFLATEIARIAEILGPGHPVTHIHWGGGSPTMLSPADVLKVAGWLRERFEVAPDAEFAIEIDPRGLTDETIAALAKAGVNRASIGVQDCDDKVQKAINRIQPFEVTESAVTRLRAAGINALNIDLIYGLPYQTKEKLARTIEQMLTLDPDRLAVFGYAHVPHFKKHMQLIPTESLPSPEERAEQFELGHALLSASGYTAIGLDHFAKPTDALAIAQANGTLARNFQGYTTDSAPALIGLGAVTLWRTRRVTGNRPWRYGRRALLAVGAFVGFSVGMMPLGVAYITTHAERSVVPAVVEQAGGQGRAWTQRDRALQRRAPGDLQGLAAVHLREGHQARRRAWQRGGLVPRGQGHLEGGKVCEQGFELGFELGLVTRGRCPRRRD